jgi:AmiR/NasT family two-component response regulator
MELEPRRQLRVLLADEREQHLDHIAVLLGRLGHIVVARETDIGSVGARSERESADVAIVAVDDDHAHAQGLISEIVREAACPVIVLIRAEDPAFIREAARRGVFAYLTNAVEDEQLESAIEVVLYRFAEYHALEGAFGRRATIERAKGILMERHGVDEEAAFRMLRDRSRSSSRKLIEVARAVLDARSLLPPTGGLPPR